MVVKQMKKVGRSVWVVVLVVMECYINWSNRQVRRVNDKSHGCLRHTQLITPHGLRVMWTFLRRLYKFGNVNIFYSWRLVILHSDSENFS